MFLMLFIGGPEIMSKAGHQKSVHLFITGGGGCWKSHLLRKIYQAVTKTLMYNNGGDRDKPRVLLLALSGVAAVNIDDTTIHFGLNCKGQFYPLNEN